MMDSGDQFGVGAVFQEYGEHLAAEGEVKELLRGTTRLHNWTLFLLVHHDIAMLSLDLRDPVLYHFLALVTDNFLHAFKTRGDTYFKSPQ